MLFNSLTSKEEKNEIFYIQVGQKHGKVNN